jgi:nicotinate-nucleotide--dimethylbenzimidazole phosphoribosyltransferase
MGGISGFLLGGVLGATLGYLLTRSRSQKVRQGARSVLPPRATPSGGPWVHTAGPGPLTVEPEAAVEPEVETAPEHQAIAVVPEPEIEAQPEPEPVAMGPEIAPVPEPVAPVPEIEPWPEMEAEPEPVALEPEAAVEPEIEAQPEPEPVAMGPEIAPLPEPLAPVPEPEVETAAVEAPESFGWPIAVAGWKPSVAAAGDEAVTDLSPPVVAEDTPAYAGLDVAAQEERKSSWPGVASAEPEAETIPAEPGVPDLGLEPGAGVPSEPDIGPPPARIAADDLKARIEATRRRIRRELEEPFVTAEDEAATQPIVVPPLPEPVIGSALMQEPSVEVGQAPLAGEAEAALVGIDVGEAGGAGETREQLASGSDLEYDAMRSRIEITRNRLKAKAFDAMMTGESALLGRDSADAVTGHPAVADVDTEVVETIESTLREEDR